MTDFRVLCAELVEELVAWVQADETHPPDEAHYRLVARRLVDRVRAALSQPEPEGPTDEKLLRIAANAIEPYESSGIAIGEYEPETECAVEAYGSELIAYARAVLARWGRPTPQPIPVSERLPGWEERCWWFDLEGQWYLRSQAEINIAGLRLPAYWLPAHALPVPTHTSENGFDS